MLLFRGQWPKHVPLDESIPALAGGFQYPTKYGYSAVGEVIEMGKDVPKEWLGRMVFAFNPHESLFCTPVHQLVLVPDEASPEDMLFLPNMETAVSFVMDGAPVIGEQVVALGQGVVGLLTCALLSQMPLANLLTVDAHSLRRKESLALGAHETFSPNDSAGFQKILRRLKENNPSGQADLTYELSGNPEALDMAIHLTDYSGRVVIGSWYGEKRTQVDLGGYFHRSAITIKSSQVSRIHPSFSGRFTKNRRLHFAVRMLEAVRPERLITHRIPIERAKEAYELIDLTPGETLQVIFTYENQK